MTNLALQGNAKKTSHLKCNTKYRKKKSLKVYIVTFHSCDFEAQYVLPIWSYTPKNKISLKISLDNGTTQVPTWNMKIHSGRIRFQVRPQRLLQSFKKIMKHKGNKAPEQKPAEIDQ